MRRKKRSTFNIQRSTSSDAQAAVDGLLDVQCSMLNVKCFPFFYFAFLILLAALLAPVSTGRAEEFGDIVVAPGAMYSGNTFHGYAEIAHCPGEPFNQPDAQYHARLSQPRLEQRQQH
jgi:hypothetical protein